MFMIHEMLLFYCLRNTRGVKILVPYLVLRFDAGFKSSSFEFPRQSWLQVKSQFDVLFPIEIFTEQQNGI